MWGASTKLGLKFKGKLTDSDEIKDAVNSGKIVVLNVKKGDHWVLAKRISGDEYHVQDPVYAKLTYSSSDILLAAVFSV